MSVLRFPRALRHPIAALLMFGLSLAPQNSYAGTATASIAVSATVLSVCIVAATPLAFGDYTSSSGTATTATASVVVTCSYGNNYTVALGAGTGTGATVASRLMTNGSSTLGYNLYTNSGYSTIWGDGTNSTSTQAGTAGLLPTTYTVYGRIPAGQYATNGVYSDSITVTVSY